MIEAAVFDLYETLITEFDPEWKQGPTVAERLGMEEPAFRSAWSQMRENRFLGLIPDYSSVLREICTNAGIQVDECVLQTLLEERRALKARPFAMMDESVVNMVATLRSRGLRLGLVSNACVEEAEGWDTCKLARHFDSVVFSYQAHRMKPDPAIYTLACGRLGVAPERTVFVGDGGDRELTGAADVGMSPFWATWFLDRWPMSTNRHAGALKHGADRFPRLRLPSDLVSVLSKSRTTRD